MRRSKPKRGVVAFARRWYRRVMWLRLAAMVVGAAYGVATALRRKPWKRLPPGSPGAGGGPGGGGGSPAPRPITPRSPAGGLARDLPREGAPVALAVLARTATAVAADAPAWVAPTDGVCPDGYPIKANATSMIYHQPGGLSYERTHSDRCYVDGASAEADGFRAAKI